MQVNTFYYKNNQSPVAYVIKNIFSKELSHTYEKYYKSTGILKLENPAPSNISYDKGSNTFACYCDDLGVAILEGLKDTISNILKKEILPSYVYTRVYTKGTKLISHRDRESCEISVTLSLCNSDNDKEEYLYISDKSVENSSPDDILKIPVHTGDALIFFGSNDSGGYYHWRDVTESEFILQSFLHYVTVNGKFKHNAFEWTKK